MREFLLLFDESPQHVTLLVRQGEPVVPSHAQLLREYGDQRL